MTVEEQVRTGLAELVAEIRPMPDPLGRLLARQRRRRRRGAAVVALVVALVAGGAVVPLAVGGWPGPPVGYEAWTRSLVDGPPRGAVAARPGFAADLARALDEQDRAGAGDPRLGGPANIDPAARSVRVVFVDDVAASRVAVVALLPPDDGVHAFAKDTVVLSLTAPAGATPATLASAARAGTKPAGTGLQTIDLSPFLVLEPYPAGTTLPGPLPAIGLAPPGCEVSSAPWPTASTWKAEPTGSYVVRTADVRRAEWWRVTCDGVVRHEGGAPVITDPASRDSVQVTAEVAELTARDNVNVSPDLVLTQRAMAELKLQAGYHLADPGAQEVVWGGPIPGLSPAGGSAVVVTGPLVRGGWVGTVVIVADRDRPTATLTLSGFNSPYPPIAPAPLAVWLDASQPGAAARMLVVAPEGTKSVRIVHNGQTISQGDVVGGMVVLSAPNESGTAVETLDAAGSTLTQSEPRGPRLSLSSELVNNWDG
jgi:hypothetical protein